MAESVREISALGGLAELQVAAPPGAVLSEPLVESLAAIAGVQEAVPVLTRHVALNGRDVILYGVDARSEALRGPVGNRVGHEIHVSTRNPDDYQHGIFLGGRLATDLRVRSGDSVSVSGVPRPRRISVLEVVGADGGPDPNAGYYAVAILRLAQDILSLHGSADSVYIVEQSGADRVAVRAAVVAAAGGHGQVLSPGDQFDRATGFLVPLQGLLGVLAALVVVLATLLVLEVLTVAVAGRRRDLALGRLVGRSRRSVLGGFLGEVVLVSLAAILTGVVIGSLSAPLIIAGVPAYYDAALGVRITSHPSVSAAAVATASTLLAALLGAAGPSIALARISPLDGIVREPRPPRTPAGRIRTRAGVVLTVLLVFGASVSASFKGPAALTALLLFTGLVTGSWLSMRPLARFAGATLGRSAAGRLAALELAASPRRGWVDTVLVLTATVTVVAVGGVSHGSSLALTSLLEPQRHADLVVQTSPASGLPTDLELPAGWRAELAAVPGVRAVGADRYRFIDAPGVRFLAIGVDSNSHDPVLRLADEAAQRRVLEGEGVIATTQFARAFHLRARDTWQTVAVRGSGRFEVATVEEFPTAVSGGEVAMSLKRFGETFGGGGVGRYEVDGDWAAVMHARALALQLADRDGIAVIAVSGDVIADSEGLIVAQASALFSAMGVVVVLATGLALGTSLVLAGGVRRRELATLRVVGASRRQVVEMMALGALVPSAFGALIGVIAGVVLHAAAASEVERLSALPVVALPDPLLLLGAALGGVGVAVGIATLVAVAVVRSDPLR